eukprot:6993535-Alexandrium_andersonii.AAC.1
MTTYRTSGTARSAASPSPRARGGASTCGHRAHDACLRDHRDHHGPAAGCPSRGPEYVTVDRRGT